MSSDEELAKALRAASLPIDDLSQSGGTFFRFTDRKGEPAGFGGIELHGKNALLRSIAVPLGMQNAGYGTAITRSLLRYAEMAGAESSYLLTTEAAPFFNKLGFKTIPKSDAPPEILATPQASGLCPSNASLMVRSVSL
ncbi:arsenic resistance N-acetyltransferase ArsN2 [Phyllobacterium sp. K27]